MSSRLAQDTGLVSRIPGRDLHTKLYANERPFTRATTLARAVCNVCTDAPWKKDCASWYAAASGMKFRVRARRRRIEGAFYGVITFQRRRNSAESSRSSFRRFCLFSSSPPPPSPARSGPFCPLFPLRWRGEEIKQVMRVERSFFREIAGRTVH